MLGFPPSVEDFPMASWSKDAAFYRQKQWILFSKAYLAAHPTCVVPGCAEPASHVDHKQAIAKGGDGWNPQNLQSLCRPHHHQKSAIFDRPSRPSKRTRLTVRGCDVHGNPLDPLAAWYTDKR
jgi:hypothetical protein